MKVVLERFKKDKGPQQDGWTIEFFLDIFYLLGEDLVKVVEDTKAFGNIPTIFNSTFISLILKVDNPISLNDFRPIFSTTAFLWWLLRSSLEDSRTSFQLIYLENSLASWKVRKFTRPLG